MRIRPPDRELARNVGAVGVSARLPQLVVIEREWPGGGDADQQARADMRRVARRIARAARDGDLTEPMALEDAAALARLVLAYTGGEGRP